MRSAASIIAAAAVSSRSLVPEMNLRFRFQFAGVCCNLATISQPLEYSAAQFKVIHLSVNLIMLIKSGNNDGLLS